MKAWVPMAVWCLAFAACGEAERDPEVASDAGDPEVASDAGPDDQTVVLDGGAVCDCAAAYVSLECVCGFIDCPTFEEATMVRECGTVPAPEGDVTFGCYAIWVRSRNRGGASYWAFDTETHELVAAQRVDDVAWGPCSTGQYVTPDVTPAPNHEPQCEESTTCSICVGAENPCDLP